MQFRQTKSHLVAAILIVLTANKSFAFAANIKSIASRFSPSWAKAREIFNLNLPLPDSSDFPEWNWRKDHLVCHLWYPDGHLRKVYMAKRISSKKDPQSEQRPEMKIERLILSESTCESNPNLILPLEVYFCRNPGVAFNLSYRKNDVKATLIGYGTLPSPLIFKKFNNDLIFKAVDGALGNSKEVYGYCQAY